MYQYQNNFAEEKSLSLNCAPCNEFHGMEMVKFSKINALNKPVSLQLVCTSLMSQIFLVVSRTVSAPLGHFRPQFSAIWHQMQVSGRPSLVDRMGLRMR